MLITWTQNPLLVNANVALYLLDVYISDCLLTYHLKGPCGKKQNWFLHSVLIAQMHCGHLYGHTCWVHFLLHKTFAKPIRFLQMVYIHWNSATSLEGMCVASPGWMHSHVCPCACAHDEQDRDLLPEKQFHTDQLEKKKTVYQSARWTDRQTVHKA